jgi:hypothetical protein
LEDDLDGAANIELVVKLGTCTGRLNIAVEFDKLGKQMSMSIVVLCQIPENQMGYFAAHATRQEHDVDNFGHQKWILEVLRVAQEDEEIVRKVRTNVSEKS